MKSSSPFHVLFLKGNLKLVAFVILVQQLVTATMTTAGLLELADSEKDVILAVLFGITLGALFYVIWLAIFRKISEPNTNMKTKIAVMVLSFGLAPALFVTSSQFNVVALASDEAKAAFQTQEVTKVQDYSARNSQKVQNLKSLRDDLVLMAGSFERGAQSELEHGVFSGRNGTGTVYNTLVILAKRIKGIIANIDNTLIEYPKLVDKSERLIGKMLNVLNSDDSMGVKEMHLKKIYSELSAVNAEMSVDKSIASIDRQLSSMGSELKVMADFSPNQKIRLAQEDALNRLQDYVAEINEPVLESTALLLASPTEPLKAIDAVTPMQATRLMWRQVAPQWSAALALDYLPYAILILLFISSAGIKKEDEPIDDFLDVTADDILKVIRLKSIIDHDRHDPEYADKVINRVFRLEDDHQEKESDDAPVK